jgi:excisionase family DNA binding protein
MNIQTIPQTFTPKEVAESLDLNPSTIYSLLSRGELQAYHYGRRRFISKAQLDDYLAKRNRLELVDMTYACGPTLKLIR